jgi:heme/copper-type cytochrome/quinol oxidase subunit 2
VPAPSSIWLWVVVLGGPVVWIVHFMVVYLAAEAVCTPGRVGGDRPWSDDQLDVFIVAATAIAVAVCAIAGSIARRRVRAEGRHLWWVGVVLAIGAAASVIAVGAPALAVGTC